jgi:hypothetical protein
MPFAGEAFEEFVGEYFKYMPQYKGYVVNVHVEYKRDRQLQQIVRGRVNQPRWSDIDVLAIKGEEAIIVSCDENCAKKLNEIVEEFSFAEHFIKQEYPYIKSIKKVYAFCMGWNPKTDGAKLQQLQKLNVEILTFTQMVRGFLKELRKRERYGITAGKFTEPILWALREIDMIRVLSGKNFLPSVEGIRKKLHIRKRNVIIKWP